MSLSTPSDVSTRPFMTLWTGQALSMLGTQTAQFALVWWLTVETGSAAILASGTLLALLPRIVLGPVIGSLVDRWPRGRVMLGADAGLALLSGVVAVLFLTGTVEPWHVLALLLLRGVGEAFHETALTASMTLMVPADRLTRFQGLNQALQGLLLVAAPPLGALAFATLPMAGVMGIDVVTAGFAIGALLLVRVPRPSRDAAGEGIGDGVGSSLWSETLEGLRYVARRRGHLALLAMVALVNLFLTPAFALLPLLVHQHGGGAARLGWLSAAFGVGMLAGGILLGAWGGFRRRMHTALAGLVGLGLASAAMGVVSPTALVFGVLPLLVGALATLVNGPIQAVLQATIPPELQGRVFTLSTTLATAATPVGLAVAAPVAESLGVGFWFVAGGLGATAMGVVAFLVPSVARIEDDAADAGVSTDAAVGATDEENLPRDSAHGTAGALSEAAESTGPANLQTSRTP